MPTKTVIADAADVAGRDAAIARVVAATRDIDLGVLINNVGASHEMPVAFADTDPAEIDAIIQTVSGALRWPREKKKSTRPAD